MHSTFCIINLIKQGEQTLINHNIDDAKQNACHICAYILQIKASQLPHYWHKEATNEQVNKFNDLINRRCKHEPLQYLIAEWSFLDFDLDVNNSVLIPRPETEDLFLALKSEISQRPYSNSFEFADIGTGSGVLAIAIAKNFAGSQGFMIDISQNALNTAINNANKFKTISNRLKPIKNDLLSGFKKASLDVIVSNPPYISTSEIPILQPEVRDFEPHIALDGGEDGLQIIKRLIVESAQVLKTGGILAFEHGHEQQATILQLIDSDLFKTIKTGKDLAGKDRFIILERI